jgi:hypothetical protein
MSDRVECEGLKLAVRAAELVEQFGIEVLDSMARHLREQGVDLSALDETLSYLHELEEDY